VCIIWGGRFADSGKVVESVGRAQSEWHVPGLRQPWSSGKDRYGRVQS